MRFSLSHSLIRSALLLSPSHSRSVPVSLSLSLRWTDGTQEATAGSSYQEFSISDVSTSLTAFQYPDDDEATNFTEPWPNVRYDITLRRSSLYHQLLILAPGIILTSLSLTVFFMRPDSSERLSFGITLILANEVLYGLR